MVDHSRRKRNLLRNSFFNSSSWASSVIANLVTIPLLVHFLGVELYGIYALLTGLYGYFSLLDLGLGQGIIRYVAHYRGLDQEQGLFQSVNSALLIQVVLGIAGFVALVLFAEDILHALNIGSPHFSESWTALMLSAVGFLVTMILGNFSFVLQGLQRFDLLAKINAVFSIAGALSTVAVVILGGGLVSVVAVSLIFSVGNALAWLISAMRMMPGYRMNFSIAIQPTIEIVRFSAYTFISRLGNLLNTYFVRFIVSMFWGPQAVTYFVVPMKLASFFQGAIGSLAGVLFPFTTDAMAQGKDEKLKSVYLRSSTYLAAVSLPALLFLVIFARQVLSVWMGEMFSSTAWPTLTLLALSSLLSILTMAPTNAALGLGKSREIAIFSSGVVAINLLTSFWFTAKWGFVGTAVSVLVTQSMALPFVWYVTEKSIGMSWQKYVKDVFRVQAAPVAIFTSLGLVIVLLANSVGFHHDLAVLCCGAFLPLGFYVYAVRSGIISIADIRMAFPKKSARPT